MTCKVFLIDDSAQVRQAMQQLLRGEPGIELVGSAPSPLAAAATIRRSRPDVLMLDVEMPGIDGMTVLRQVMDQAAVPTVICSALTTRSSRMTQDALAAGAVAVVTKPRYQLQLFLEQSRRELVQTLKTAACAGLRGNPAALRRTAPADARTAAADAPAGSADAAAGLAPRPLAALRPVVIGGSTGGAQAIEIVLQALPPDSPGIAIVQHMPQRFTAMYARRLDALCAVNVRVARHGDRLERGTVLIAPGGQQMHLRSAGGQQYAVVIDPLPASRHKPSVDALFGSVADCAGGDALAIILTGMGDDGARGMKRLHDRGALTIAQDQQTSAAFGMPGRAIALGAVDQVLPIQQVAAAIGRFDARD